MESYLSENNNDNNRDMKWGWDTPHCHHKDYNHPNAWGMPYHVGHPTKNSLAHLEALLRDFLND